MTIKGMTYYHVNTRSIYGKLNQIDILYNDVDILCCTETWLDNRYSNDMVSLPGKFIFRADRKNNIGSFRSRPTAGGVCIYVKNYLYNFTKVFDEGTAITYDYEIISTITTRPDHRQFVAICVYKPPKGNLRKCTDFLSTILSKGILNKKEIWILGDFNTDLLKRDDANTIVLQNFAKRWGLRQCISEITRPNNRGGICIDLIMSNSPFISSSGVTDDMLSDHFTVFCVRKKRKEVKVIKIETVRDFKNYNEKSFCQLIDAVDWTNFDVNLDPAAQWNYIHDAVLDILAIMCPYKIVHSRVSGNKWITKNIFRLIRERKCLIKRFKATGNQELLSGMRILRNRVNSAVDKAKSDYVKTLLVTSRSNAKKFWRNIKCLIEEEVDIVENVTFKNPSTGENVSKENRCNFVNKFFAEIEERICSKDESRPYIAGPKVESVFQFLPPELYDIMIFSDAIDVNTSSAITGINMKLCKTIIQHIPEKFRMIFANSMFSGIFPAQWATSNVKLLPKAGDVSNPGNWRPISLTNVFSKILEKLVHKQMLQYLLDKELISNFQYGFLPGKSTHEAIFKTVKEIYSALNQKELMGI